MMEVIPEKRRSH